MLCVQKSYSQMHAAEGVHIVLLIEFLPSAFSEPAPVCKLLVVWEG